MPGVRSHEELITWQLAHEVKLQVYKLLDEDRVRRDFDFSRQLRESAASAPRNIAEGFGRYLRIANGELKETQDALRDGFDRGYFSRDDVVRVQRLAKRASKAATNLIAYLRKATPPNEDRR